MTKTALSFYLDDTNPYDAPPEAFKTFLDFVSSEGVRGESSIILGFEADRYGLLSRPTTEEQRSFIQQLRRAFDCGIDGHMELMTHGPLFDFDSGSVPVDAIHEGLWLHEPSVSVDAYESYFQHIAEEAERIGLAFTGVTWPGCDCQRCQQRHAELRRGGSSGVNSNVGAALVNVARRGGFQGRTVPCFTFSSPREKPRLMAGDDLHSVWDLMPNAGDMLGSYTKSRELASADGYVAADGSAGRIVELVQAGERYCLFYAHWQGLNPANGAGWTAFTQVVRRVNTHLRDQIVWVRPSEYTERLHSS